ncbi:MAG TPA: septum formation initiator [Pseudonocardiaceae bacterium]|nr:septum formation initiator [Pseudonocardiaceae bacterium]
MTAPARVAGPARSRTRTPPPSREREPERAPGTRGRSAAAERAYARRAQRSERATGVTPTVKTERRPGSASWATFVVMVMALLVCGVVATLWFSTQATADAYRLEQAKKATSALSVRVAQLQQQVDQQDSAPALGDRARQLGMVPAGDPSHLVVGPDGSVALIGTPSVARTPPPPATTTPPVTTTTPPPSTNAATTTSTPTTTTSPGG